MTQQTETVTLKCSNSLTRLERQELNNLSLYVYGKTSYWQKLVNKGVSRVATQEVQEEVPEDQQAELNGQKTRTVHRPIKHGNGFLMHTQRTTVEEIHARMLVMKSLIEKSLAEKTAKEVADKANKAAHDVLSGSAL